ncbi:hypothetical protein [Streptomyces sp. Inha503]|uniref:hypothetical protein n=1 Tax=Streptomyces sp. Inha503 TaxID=3383314 RepID=UPI00399FE5F0
MGVATAVVRAPAPNCAKATPTITGREGSDVITGTPGDDVIFALGGSDVVDGVGGNDLVCGGTTPGAMSSWAVSVTTPTTAARESTSVPTPIPAPVADRHCRSRRFCRVLVSEG